MTATLAQGALPEVRTEVMARMTRRRLMSFAVPAAVLTYLVYALFAFNLPELLGKARWENGATLISDSYSYKTHVTRENRSGEVGVAIEGERKGTYANPAQWPDWVREDAGVTDVALKDGAGVRIAPEDVRMVLPGYGTLVIVPERSGITITAPEGKALPDYVSASNTRVQVTAPEGRLTVTKAKTEVFRYSYGWELWFFDLESPFHFMSWGQIGQALVSGQELRPGMSNLSAMLQDFWNNGMWQHGRVFGAMLETLLMAFLGTMGGALIALPLAFLAARNFSVLPVRFGVRRVFDFLRGVDGLIWTIILSRAFGPGPLTGALAILITDTGSFGKLFSEALENIDGKQVEGLRSTGAGTLQRNRWGVIPQVAPVILSQVLYFLESNTRSATVIGAIVGGGIGLLLTQALITQKDWEEVAYFITLILLMVMAMDWLSGKIRRRLIKGE
ncbi:phosphonate ABC transporter, permease protein PhnE [Frigidibacter sp. MR17.14]|uniref:phosphonate ABC transporter, permease protein PhnE n=1 Tax=Frigidibacter sp. MR17.14 TaxID=3126509 RepID=UPI003012F2C1